MVISVVASERVIFVVPFVNNVVPTRILVAAVSEKVFATEKLVSEKVTGP